MSQARKSSSPDNELPELNTFFHGNGPKVVFNSKKRVIQHGHDYTIRRQTLSDLNDQYCLNAQ